MQQAAVSHDLRLKKRALIRLLAAASSLQAALAEATIWYQRRLLQQVRFPAPCNVHPLHGCRPFPMHVPMSISPDSDTDQGLNALLERSCNASESIQVLQAFC